MSEKRTGKKPIPSSATKSESLPSSGEEKDVVWFPDHLRLEIRNEWSSEVRQIAGVELGRVQLGLQPVHYREMPSIASGVKEIKVQDEHKSQYRLMYIAKFPEAVYVIHVITKKTSQKTDKADIELAKKRYKQLQVERQKRVSHE